MYDSTATEPPDLKATGWAVLGLLSFGEELSGYDLKQWADWSLSFFYWAPSYSQIYNELRRLENLGLATSRVIIQEEVRGKRLYRIAAAGEEALTAWARDSGPDPAVLKHGVMLRLWLGHTAGPDQLRRTLERHRAWSEARRTAAAEHMVGAAQEPGWAYPELVLRWSERYYADERDRAEQMLNELDEATAKRRRAEGATTATHRSFKELRRDAG